MILRLMSVLTHGKEAKRIADKAIDIMAGVQNLRQAIYEYVSRCSCIGDVAHVSLAVTS